MTALHQGLLLGQIAPACNMSFTCVLQQWQDVSESFFEGFIISHLNAMFDLTSTSQLVIIKGEDIMILHQHQQVFVMISALTAETQVATAQSNMLFLTQAQGVANLSILLSLRVAIT